MKKVYIVIDDRTGYIAGVFSKRNKAAKYISEQSEPGMFCLYTHKVE